MTNSLDVAQGITMIFKIQSKYVFLCVPNISSFSQMTIVEMVLLVYTVLYLDWVVCMLVYHISVILVLLMSGFNYCIAS